MGTLAQQIGSDMNRVEPLIQLRMDRLEQLVTQLQKGMQRINQLSDDQPRPGR
jgi:hypothetical protein